MANSAISILNGVSSCSEVGGTNSRAPIPLRPIYANLSKALRSLVLIPFCLAHSLKTKFPQWSGMESAMNEGNPPKSLSLSGYTGNPFFAIFPAIEALNGAISYPDFIKDGSK